MSQPLPLAERGDSTLTRPHVPDRPLESRTRAPLRSENEHETLGHRLYGANVVTLLGRDAATVRPAVRAVRAGRWKCRFIDPYAFWFSISYICYFALRLATESVVSREDFTYFYVCGAAVIVLAYLITDPNAIPSFWQVFGFASYVAVRYAMGRGSGNSEIQQISVFQYCSPTLFFVLGYQIWRRGWFDRLVLVFSVLSAVSLAVGLYQHFFGGLEDFFLKTALDKAVVAGEVERRCSSLAGNSLATAFLAAVCLLCAVGRRRRSFSIMLVAGVSLLATLSRGGVVMTAIGLACRLLARARRYRIRSSRFIAPILAGLALLGILGYLADSRAGNVYSARLMDTFNIREGGNASRVESWEVAFAMWWTNPVFGAGLGQLGASPVKYGFAQLAPESTYLKILGETGIAGMILYLLAVLPPVIGAIRKARVDTPSAAERAQRDVSVVLAILGGGLFLQNTEYDFFAGIFWLWLGGLAAYTRCGIQSSAEVPLCTATK